MAVHECEVWVLVDENGDYAIAKDESDLSDAYDSDVGSSSEVCRRAVKVVLRVPVEAYVTLSADVPHEGEARLTVA